MPCLPAFLRFHGGALTLGALAFSVSCAPLATRLRGTSTYRAPAIVLAYPEPGTALPVDRPVILFRFAPREADDPIDAASFRATVDGVDRTTQFRVTTVEAWGTLSDSTMTGSGVTRVTPGPHAVGARVCTARGVCGALTVVVDVRSWQRMLEPVAATQVRARPHRLTL